MRKLYVYAVRGPDGVYVGETCNPRTRWHQHRSRYRTDRSSNLLYQSMRQHGKAAFTFEVVATTLEYNREHSRYIEDTVAAQYALAGERVFNFPDLGRGVTHGPMAPLETEAWKAARPAHWAALGARLPLPHRDGSNCHSERCCAQNQQGA